MLLPALVALMMMSHPMHVAYTSIEINPETKDISVTHKVFADDFSLLFFHLFEKNVIPDSAGNFGPEEKKLIDHYLKYRFFILSDQDTVTLHVRENRLEDHTLWLAYAGNIRNSDCKRLEINNMLFLDLNMDQTNLVIFNYGKLEKGLTFNWENRQEIIELKE